MFITEPADTFKDITSELKLKLKKAPQSKNRATKDGSFPLEDQAGEKNVVTKRERENQNLDPCS